MSNIKVELLKTQVATYDQLKVDCEQLTIELDLAKENYYKAQEAQNVDLQKLLLQQMEEKSVILVDKKKVIQSYSEKNIIIVKKFIEANNTFTFLSDRIKEIEMFSKKLNGSKVEVLSAEGRKKHIDSSLVEEYEKFVNIKKTLSNNVANGYKTVMGITIDIPSSISPEVQQEVNKPIVSEIVVSEPVELVVNQPNNVVLDSYGSLSNDEKLKETNDRLERIIAASKKPGSGKKKFVTLENGAKMDMAISLIGVYGATLGEKRKLERLINGEAKKEAPDTTFAIPAPVPVMELKPENKIVAVKKAKAGMFNKIKSQAKKMIAAAALVAIITVSLASGLLNKDYNPANKNNVTQPTTIEKTESIAVNNNFEKPVFENVAKNEVPTTSEVNESIIPVSSEPAIDLNEKITVAPDAKIYADSHSMAVEQNGKATYFDSEKERNISGVTFSQGGKVQTIYKNDPDFDYKMQFFNDAGWRLEGYLTSVNEGTYEGYFEADSIEQGRQR